MDYIDKYEKGTLYNAYEYFGAHISDIGYLFRVYAPNALRVSIIGSFNSYIPELMIKTDERGVFEIDLEVNELEDYLFIIDSGTETYYKSDPFAFYSTKRPSTNSLIYDIKKINKNTPLGVDSEGPVVIYELHLGSFNLSSDYRSLSEEIVKHCLEFGFTHIELLPITEHPLDESWGYQTSGYFSPTSRYGTPGEFAEFIRYCHEYNIGVILDFVPGHFVADNHALGKFDGSNLYEIDGNFEKSEWGTLNTDFSKGPSMSFMLSSANYFIEYFGIDALRIDAVNNIIYDKLGNENKAGISFLQKLNKLNIVTFAEDSSMYSGVTDKGKLAFNYKWSIGFMNTTLKYFSGDELKRKTMINDLMHLFNYAFTEKFLLEYSHDEVVHLKKSLFNKMLGDTNSKFQNLRLMLGFMFAFPGKKLLFMGAEFAQKLEWDISGQLQWELHDENVKFVNYVKKLINFYKTEEILYSTDFLNNSLEVLPIQNELLIVYERSLDSTITIVMNTSDSELEYKSSRNLVVVLSSDDLSFGGNGIISNNDKLEKQFVIPKNTIIYMKDVE